MLRTRPSRPRRKLLNALIWYLLRSSKLSETAWAALRATANAGDAIYVSSISLVEIRFLVERNRFPESMLQQAEDAVEQDDTVLTLVPLTLEITRAMARIPRASVPEMPDRSFPGKVTRIADALEPGTRTLLAEIDVPNPDEALTPGIYCTVELHIPRRTPSLVVPAEAIIFDRDGLRVATIENGAVRFKKVSVTRDSGRQVEISDGVKPGDQVILNPPVNLAEGSKVSARSDTAAPSTSS